MSVVAFKKFALYMIILSEINLSQMLTLRAGEDVRIRKPLLRRSSCQTTSECGGESRGSCGDQGSCQCLRAASGKSCETCARNIYAENCTVVCDEILNCSGHGRCSWNGGPCLCFRGWTGLSCGISAVYGFGTTSVQTEGTTGKKQVALTSLNISSTSTLSFTDLNSSSTGTV